MMRAEEECGEKRQRGVEKNCRDKNKAVGPIQESSETVLQKQNRKTSLPWWKLYKSPLKKMMTFWELRSLPKICLTHLTHILRAFTL